MEMMWHCPRQRGGPWRSSRAGRSLRVWLPRTKDARGGARLTGAGAGEAGGAPRRAKEMVLDSFPFLWVAIEMHRTLGRDWKLKEINVGRSVNTVLLVTGRESPAAVFALRECPRRPLSRALSPPWQPLEVHFQILGPGLPSRVTADERCAPLTGPCRPGARRPDTRERSPRVSRTGGQPSLAVNSEAQAQPVLYHFQNG